MSEFTIVCLSSSSLLLITARLSNHMTSLAVIRCVVCKTTSFNSRNASQSVVQHFKIDDEGDKTVCGACWLRFVRQITEKVQLLLCVCFVFVLFCFVFVLFCFVLFLFCFVLFCFVFVLFLFCFVLF